MRIAGRRKILILLFAVVFLMSSVFPATAMAKSVFGGEDVGGGADFTVQYYANVPEYSDEATGSPLTVIDTSGGILPENSDGPDGVKTTQIYLDEDGRVKMDDTLAPIYTEERFSYYRAPGLNYFDKVSLSSANYDLKEIWVMKDSCDDPASIDYEDWTMYVEVDICPVQFTNDPENAGQTGTVTDGTAYTDRDLTTPDTQDQMDDPSTILYVNTRQKGINSPENYSGYGAKYAFGNSDSNGGTTLGDQKLNGYFINKGNKLDGAQEDLTFKRLCFGLASATLTGGNPLAGVSGLTAPDIFGTGESVKGMTRTDEWDLSFDRQGDTYTLRSVKDAEGNNLGSAENLDRSLIRADMSTSGPITSGLWTKQSGQIQSVMTR